MNQLKIKLLIIIFLSLFLSLLYSQSKSLIDQMIDASISGDEEKVLQIKSSIESITKPPKGDRKTARTLNDKALFELNAGNFDAAVELLAKAYETDQSDTEVASNLGYALIKSGNIKQAEAPFNHSIMLNPNRTDAWANLSEFFADKGDFRSSTAVLNIAYLLSVNKDKTKVYFQKFLIDNRENKILVAAATEALRDEGIKPVSEFVLIQEPDNTNLVSKSDEVTTSNNQGSEASNNASSQSTYIPEKTEPARAIGPAGSQRLKAATGNVPSNATVFHIGDNGPAGGKVFYLSDNTGLHGLEAAPADQVDSTGNAAFAWGCHYIAIPDAQGTAVGTGAANTAAIVVGCNEANTAAKIAYSYALNGYTDWFLPSKDELNLLYQQKNVVSGFARNYYWSSTESDIFNAWAHYFASGGQEEGVKSGPYPVRAVRAF